MNISDGFGMKMVQQLSFKIYVICPPNVNTNCVLQDIFPFKVSSTTYFKNQADMLDVQNRIPNEIQDGFEY